MIEKKKKKTQTNEGTYSRVMSLKLETVMTEHDLTRSRK